MVKMKPKVARPNLYRQEYNTEVIVKKKIAGVFLKKKFGVI